MELKLWDLDTKFLFGRQPLNKHICLFFSPKYCNAIVINANFIFSHYKPMETLSCHCNKITYATAIKQSFIEANFINISGKFQLHPPYGFSVN